MPASLTVRPVESPRERRAFAQFPWRIYRHDPLWVPPLLSDRLRAFDQEHHRFYRHGEAAFFSAYRGARLLGTICVAEDRFHNRHTGLADAMIGFFDCVEDESVARGLFARAAGWARDRGLARLVGPFNLDYENGYGILLEGRDRRPAILCGHTPPYYRGFFERAGFYPARAVNIALGVDLRESTPELVHLAELADRVRSRGRFAVREGDFDRWDEEVATVTRLMNGSLRVLPDFFPVSEDDVRQLVGDFKELADPRLILFVLDRGVPVGWIAAVPDFNERLARLNGLRRPWDYLRVPFALAGRLKTASMKSILLLPAYHKTGAILPALDDIAQRLIEGGYEWLDLSLTAEDNPQTPYIARRFGAQVYKRYQVYAKDIESPDRMGRTL